MKLNKVTWTSVIGALGIVFGDIGTSPLYVLKECFNPSHNIALTENNVLGIISLIFWSLFLGVVVKYITLMMRADNDGEGGPMALLSLITGSSRLLYVPKIVMLGLLGAALLFGDGIITPAISVISAVEGLKVISPDFSKYVVIITVVILLGTFLIQKKGTEAVGQFFGPITLIWFIVIGLMGIVPIIKNPSVFKAINPWYAYLFFSQNGMAGFLVLGAVLLCITGGEAIYSDMGHVGIIPIKKAWYFVVYPSLILNYFGQGALLITRGSEVVENPFYNLVSGWMIFPLVALATLAAIIASQALITGSFSIAQQAMQLGYLPRMNVVYTSKDVMGQIYIPVVNFILMYASIALVLMLKTSSNLAQVYGVAVITTMLISSIMFFVVTRSLWNWPLWKSLSLVGLFVFVELSFILANLVKVIHGGWIALSIGVFVYWVMLTWKKGNIELYKEIRVSSPTLEEFVETLEHEIYQTIPGTGIFMTVNKGFVPFVLMNNLKHNKILHHNTVILSILSEPRPEVPREEKIEISSFGKGIYKINAHYGFMEKARVSEILSLIEEKSKVDINRAELSFYLGRENIKITGKVKMHKITKRLYQFMKMNSQSAPEYFQIPYDQAIEIGGNVNI